MNLKELVVQFNTAKTAMDFAEWSLWEAVDDLMKAACTGQLSPATETIMDAWWDREGNLIIRTKLEAPGPDVYECYTIPFTISMAVNPMEAATKWKDTNQPPYSRFGRDYEATKINQQIAELQAKLIKLTTP